MRATCARVLAAALLTAAIATVVGMPALFGTPSEAGRPIAAPPSKLQRTVRLTAHLAPPHRQRTARLVTKHTNHPAPSVRTELITRSPVVIRKRQAAKRTAPRQLTDVEPATEPATPAQPTPPDGGDDQRPGNGHGRGHAYGRDKQDE